MTVQENPLPASRGAIASCLRHPWRVVLGGVLLWATVSIGRFVYHQKLLAEIGCVRLPRGYLTHRQTPIRDVGSTEKQTISAFRKKE